MNLSIESEREDDQIRAMVHAEQVRRRNEKAAAEAQELELAKILGHSGQEFSALRKTLHTKGILHVRVGTAIRLILAARKLSREILEDTHHFRDLFLAIVRATAGLPRVASGTEVGATADAFARGEIPSDEEVLKKLQPFATGADHSAELREAIGVFIKLVERRVEIGKVQDDIIAQARNGNLALWGCKKLAGALGTMEHVPQDYYRHPRALYLHEDILFPVPTQGHPLGNLSEAEWHGVEIEAQAVALILPMPVPPDPESAAKDWFATNMRNSPHPSSKSAPDWQTEAKEKFEGLTQRAAARAWAAAISATGAFKWRKPGPKSSAQ